jgi:hypothetical protein
MLLECYEIALELVEGELHVCIVREVSLAIIEFIRILWLIPWQTVEVTEKSMENSTADRKLSLIWIRTGYSLWLFICDTVVEADTAR